MDIPVFRSLSKRVTWGGLPRVYFIFLVMLGLASVFFLKSLNALVPVVFIYFVLVALYRNDSYIFEIMLRNLKSKSHYFAD